MSLPFGVPEAILVLAIATAALWWRYRKMAAEEGIGPLARREIDSISPITTGFGHAAPMRRDFSSTTK